MNIEVNEGTFLQDYTENTDKPGIVEINWLMSALYITFICSIVNFHSTEHSPGDHTLPAL